MTYLGKVKNGIIGVRMKLDCPSLYVWWDICEEWQRY